MATKKKTETTAAVKGQEYAAPEQATQQAGERLPEVVAVIPPSGFTESGSVEEETHGEPTPEAQKTASDRKEAAAAATQETTALGSGETVETAEPYYGLEELALRHRLPTWRQAALVRLMDWADGKMLTEAEYEAALTKLGGRPLGGAHPHSGGRRM